MLNFETSSRCILLAVMLSVALAAEVPQLARASIDRITGGKGTYAADDGAYRIVFPREAAATVQDSQALSPNLGLNSWVAFSSAVHQEAILTGQFLVIADEVNSVLGAVLEAGLEVTGLAALPLFDGPLLYTLDVIGRGTFQGLAGAFRKGLDEIRRVRRSYASARAKWARPAVPNESAIVGGPLDAVLSMRGTVVGGVYRAAIGKKALIRGEDIGREMGISTWISVAGTNDRAIAYGELVEGADDLQKALRALVMKGVKVESIRNHTVGEHPQLVFIRFWGQGTALELARALRYVLDVEAGAIAPPGAKI